RSLRAKLAALALHSWLKSCDTLHSLCRATSTKLPTRILDMSASVIRLVEFPNHQAPDGIYATMSHCWGCPDTKGPTRTTKDNLRARKAGIALDELSPVFRDAI
ncbi:hypothetical protein K432DRAFT_451027, partial [Lepidopterella palustris CBS 459.81]